MKLEGANGSAAIARPLPGVVVVTLLGQCGGELVDAVFREIEIDLAIQAPLQLFVDAGDASAASMNTSHVWARWLGAHRESLGRVVMLGSSRLAIIINDFVRTASGLGDAMVVLDDPYTFERALRGCGPFPKVSATWRIADDPTPTPSSDAAPSPTED